MNPYYDADKMGWEVIEFDQPNMYYEFNTLVFWKTKEGIIYTAQSSGCSCPCPFEEYDGKDEISIRQKLERVGSYEQANSTINSWNDNYGLFLEEKQKLKGWF